MAFATKPAEETPRDPTFALAVLLLRQIAEDPLLRSSYRTAARRHLRRLREPNEGRVAVKGDGEGVGD